MVTQRIAKFVLNTPFLIAIKQRVKKPRISYSPALFDPGRSMEHLQHFIHVMLHLNVYLGQWIAAYGYWTYALLFLIIFLETGVVITPFLPGDSLLFAAGTLSATTHLHVHGLVVLLILAAFCGDNTNYWFGRFLGPKVFSGHYRWLKKDYLDKTHAYYEKYGTKTLVIARFVPIVRTFAPFVAGVGNMGYHKYLTVSFLAAIFWVCLVTYVGYFFGNIPVVQRNFPIVILVIIIISILPMVIEFWRARRSQNQP